MIWFKCTFKLVLCIKFHFIRPRHWLWVYISPKCEPVILICDSVITSWESVISDYESVITDYESIFSSCKSVISSYESVISRC